jgi:hypothetical protein
VLNRIVSLAILSLAVTGCSSSDTNTGDCAVTHEQKTITTAEPAADPGLQFKIDTCRVDVDACPTLCALAMTQAGIPFNNGGTFNGVGGQPEGDVPLPPGGGFGGAPVTPAVNCDVTFEDGQVSMVVKYDVYTSTLGCPIDVNSGGDTTGEPVPFNGGPK